MGSGHSETSVSFLTLGCKVNQVESSALAGRVAALGTPVLPAVEEADIVVINTCAVTAEAEAKTRKAIRRACRDPRVRAVVVTGCSASVSESDLSGLDPKVRVVCNKDEVPATVAALRAALQDASADDASRATLVTDTPPVTNVLMEPGEAPIVYSGRTRVMVKVNDGCENFCSYCIVPYARGSQRSERAAAVVELVRDLASRGVNEVVLTGINIGKYDDPDGGGGLPQLVERLSRTGLHRIRLSSIEPVDVTDELLQVLSADRFGCEHLHIPLQSGSDRVLAHMNRGYTAARYSEVIDRVRRTWPNAAVTTDVIVGYPTETEADFEQTLAMCQEVGFSRIHVFRYSPRPGTPAAQLPSLEPTVVADRSERLRLLADELATRFADSLAGTEVETVVERVTDGNATVMARQFLTFTVPAGTLQSGDLYAFTVPTV